MVERAQCRFTVGYPEVHVHCDYAIFQEARGGAGGGMEWGGLGRSVQNGKQVVGSLLGLWNSGGC